MSARSTNYRARPEDARIKAALIWATSKLSRFILSSRPNWDYRTTSPAACWAYFHALKNKIQPAIKSGQVRALCPKVQPGRLR